MEDLFHVQDRERERERERERVRKRGRESGTSQNEGLSISVWCILIQNALLAATDTLSLCSP